MREVSQVVVVVYVPEAIGSFRFGAKKNKTYLLNEVKISIIFTMLSYMCVCVCVFKFRVYNR